MNNEPLLNVQCFLLDMDGTFNLGDELIDGSLYFIDTLQELKKDFLFLQNDRDRIKRMAGSGKDVEGLARQPQGKGAAIKRQGGQA